MSGKTVDTTATYNQWATFVSEIHKEESRVRTFKKRMGCLLLQMPFLLYTICVLPRVCYVEKNRAIVEHSEPR